MNSRAAMRGVFLAAGLSLWAGCSEVAITGRQQFNLVPDSIINSLGLQQYSQFLSENKVSADASKTAMVRRVGVRIQKAVQEFAKSSLTKDPFAGYQWEFNLVQDDSANAFAMPGGKIVVYTGILPLTQDEAGLAVVMGHEIAHVFAKHGSERMTQSLLVEMGGMALSTAIKEKPAATQQLFMTSYGLGAQIGLLLPYSRTHENEADRLGLIFMAMAGYDPQQAVAFWQRMAEQSQGRSQSLEFLSTHPLYDTRIRNLQDLIPEAMQYYRPQAG